MIAPTYTASGGVVFQREHQPVTVQRARMIEEIHRMTAAYWLGATAHSDTARLGLAKLETSLADEMAEAIRQATNPTEQKAA